jgi:hypothetical protein
MAIWRDARVAVLVLLPIWLAMPVSYWLDRCWTYSETAGRLEGVRRP